MELRANFASALALERSIKSRKKGKASLEKNQDDQVHLREEKTGLKKSFLRQSIFPHTLYDPLVCVPFCSPKGIPHAPLTFDMLKIFVIVKM